MRHWDRGEPGHSQSMGGSIIGGGSVVVVEVVASDVVWTSDVVEVDMNVVVVLVEMQSWFNEISSKAI